MEQVIASISTAKPTVLANNKNSRTVKFTYSPSKRRTILKEVHREHTFKIDDTQSTSSCGNSSFGDKGTSKCTVMEKNSHQSGVKFKIKKRMNVKKVKNAGLSKGTPKQRLERPTEEVDEVVLNSTIVEIVTGKGLSVPVCSGEEVVSSRSFLFLI